MSRNSKRTTGKSSRKSSKTRKPRGSAASRRINKQKEALDKLNVVSTAVTTVEIPEPKQVEVLTRENALFANAMLWGEHVQEDMQFAKKRLRSAEELHDYLFDRSTLANLDDKSLISLYGIAIQDINKRALYNLDIAKTSEKSKMVSELNKKWNMEEAMAQAANSESGHTNAILDALLNESLRKSMEDELIKKWNGSNSYRPPEDESYEILAIDSNASDD